MAPRRMKHFSDFHEYLEWRRPPLEDAYRRSLSQVLEGAPVGETAPLMEALGAGKKIRGCLSCLVCESLGGDPEPAVARAVAVEMIQAATLIHDDFVDQDAERGEQPAVWTIVGPRRAVLIGDVIFASAIKMMSDISAGDGRAVAEAIAHVSRGALHEPLDPLLLAAEIESNAAEQPYDKIVHLKTGALFGVACLLGALAAEGDEKATEACRRYGTAIGEAYQIADDMKDVRGCLSACLVTPRRMAALAPALLHFVSETRSLVVDSLRQNRTVLHNRAATLLNRALQLMATEVRRRLLMAMSAIESSFPKNGFAALARKAPGEIIAIFNESP